MKTLAELQIANLQRASEIKNITGVDNPEMLVKVREYLSNFVPPGPCIKCGYELSGLLGQFTWGLVHGEGYCGNCNYPARAYRNIPDVGWTTMILQYHPDVLEEREKSEAPT